MTISTVNIRNISQLSVHEKAILPYNLSSDHQYQYEKVLPDFFEPDLVLKLFPIHVIRGEGKLNYKLISGWFWITRIDCSKHKIPAIVQSNLSSLQIETIAWQYLLSLQITSFHRTSNLAQLVKLIKKMPSNVKHLVFQNHLRKTDLATIQNISNENRIVLRNQIDNYDS